MSAVQQPKLVKKPCVVRSRTFEQSTFTVDVEDVIDYLRRTHGTGTLHIHFSQGKDVSSDWDTNHDKTHPTENP